MDQRIQQAQPISLNWDSPLKPILSLCSPLFPAERPFRSSTALWAYLAPFAQDLPRPSLYAPEERVLDHAQHGVAVVLRTLGETRGRGKGWRSRREQGSRASAGGWAAEDGRGLYRCGALGSAPQNALGVAGGRGATSGSRQDGRGVSASAPRTELGEAGRGERGGAGTALHLRPASRQYPAGEPVSASPSLQY